MPVPQPHDGESEDDFVSRCMADPAMGEYDQDQRAAVCYSTWRERSATADRKGATMSERERLSELRHRRAVALEAWKALLKQDEDRPDGEPMSDDVKIQIEQLENTVNDLFARIQRLEAAMTADSEEAGKADEGDDDEDGKPDRKPDDDDDEDKAMQSAAAFGGGMTAAGYRAYARPRGDGSSEKGFKLARYMICLGWARMNGGGIDHALKMAENRFNDKAVFKALQEKALNYTVVAEGGALIPQDFMTDLIELLRANTVVRGAQPMTISMPMGNMTIPRLAGGATTYYQGELDDMRLTEQLFDDVNLVAKKLTGLVPVSNDLIRRAPIGVEQIVRDDLVQSIARREDLAFIRGDGSSQSPVGWRTLVLAANLIVVPAGATLDSVVNGLSAAILVLQNGLSRMLRPRWFMAPTILRFIATRRDNVGNFYYKDEIAGGTIEGIPFSISQQIPTNLGAGNGSEIYLVDMADTLVGDTLNVLVDASDVATYYGTDGKPISAFQRDQSLFRVISEHDFNMRHLQSLAILTTSDWAFTGLPGVPGQPWSTQALNPHWAQAPSTWPALRTGADAAPTLWDYSAARTSDFDGPLTTHPGGGADTITALGGQATVQTEPPTPTVAGATTAGGNGDTVAGNGGRGGTRR